MLRYFLIPPLLFLFQFANAQVITINIRSNITEAELRNELSIYPKHMLSMVKWIEVRHIGNSTSGLAHWDGIKLDGSYSKSTCIATLHHELSSIFLKQPKYGLFYDSLLRHFYKLNGSSLTYYTHHGYIDLPIVPLTESEKDFLVGNSYAKSDFENDFNTIAELLFTNGKDLIDDMELRPNTVIRKKVFLVIEYYKSLDPKFTVDFFTNR